MASKTRTGELFAFIDRALDKFTHNHRQYEVAFIALETVQDNFPFF